MALLFSNTLQTFLSPHLLRNFKPALGICTSRMYQVPDYSDNISLKLSDVLDEVGVSKRIVLKRRKLGLLGEAILNVPYKLTGENVSIYNFGSLTESTTTLGLKSDKDILSSRNNLNVIQDWSEWEHGVTNLLMIQDETVSPGYCLLQRLRDDAPLPIIDVGNKHSFRDRRGRILLKNTVFSPSAPLVGDGIVKHGPAQALQGVPGVTDLDFVSALPCKSWPILANQWLDQQGVGGWPSEEMRRYCCSTGCFVVAVGSKGSENEDLEWRISTSLAERCLMFNLNITQIRCYVLMKMILKTFISPLFQDAISSFMCKTVLLHCIANTYTHEWRENKLLTCLTFCLATLYNCVYDEVCPHFIIPDNNLMAGRFSPNTKPFILRVLHYVVDSKGRALLEIDCDCFGLRLKIKFSGIYRLGPEFTYNFIAGQVLKDTARTINRYSRDLLSKINDRNSTQEILQSLSKYIVRLSQGQDKVACSLIAQPLCTTLGSVLASSNIYFQGRISLEALTWLSFGLDTDVSSSKLKLASIFYCVADTERTERILRITEECYDLSVVESICGCYNFKKQGRRSAFNRLCFQQTDEVRLVKHITASCVKFLPCEINCCPQELQHEMFRSTQVDKPYRGKYDHWMDWAVVDSLPYLFFLQYKTYNSLQRHHEKQRALSNLVRTIEEEANLGHRETALNLLGQCLEQENRSTDAFKCYLLSLQLRGRNNAAKFHICRLLSTILNH